MLRYLEYAVVMQEVPDEISLAFLISGCTHHCTDCHSKYSWKNSGNPLLEDLSGILNAYLPYVTCVCFMGGDQEQSELIKACTYIREVSCKTCLYTGYDYLSDIQQELLKVLDYIKVGHFDMKYGPLSNPNTNQHMYSKVNDQWIDITHRFLPAKHLI